MITDTVNLQLNDKYYNTSYVFIHNIKHIAGDYIDGLLGLKCLSIDVLELNYQNQFVCLYQSIDSVDISSYSVIPMTTIDNQHCIPVELKMNKDLKILGNFWVNFQQALQFLS